MFRTTTLIPFPGKPTSSSLRLKRPQQQNTRLNKQGAPIKPIVSTTLSLPTPCRTHSRHFQRTLPRGPEMSGRLEAGRLHLTQRHTPKTTMARTIRAIVVGEEVVSIVAVTMRMVVVITSTIAISPVPWAAAGTITTIMVDSKAIWG